MSLVLLSLSGQPISFETKLAANTRDASLIFDQIYVNYINAIFGDQFYQGCILNMFKNFQMTVIFVNLFFTFLPEHILYVECPSGHLQGSTYKIQLSNKNRRLEAGFWLNN